MQPKGQQDTMTRARTNGAEHAAGSSTRWRGGGPLMVLVALACPLLCAGPLLVAALASTGLIRVLHNAPWPLIAAVVLVVLALGVGGTRARQARDCCAPVPTRPLGDEPLR